MLTTHHHGERKLNFKVSNSDRKIWLVESLCVQMTSTYIFLVSSPPCVAPSKGRKKRILRHC